MSPNPAFVLRGIEDVIFEDRPIPKGMRQRLHIYFNSLICFSLRQRGTRRSQENR